VGSLLAKVVHKGVGTRVKPQMNRTSAVLLIFLIGSGIVNVYFLAIMAHPSQSSPTSGTVNMGTVSLSSGQGYYREISLNGTALVTGRVVATAPINFDISYKGDIDEYAFKAASVMNLDVRVVLTQGKWSFDFIGIGSGSNVTQDTFYINYTYFS